VTPEHFFRPYNADYYSVCAAGRKDLRRFMTVQDALFLADSRFNAAELVAQGGRPEQMAVLAPFHHTEQLQHVSPSEALVRELDDGKAKILFVGRIAPNKGHRDLIRSFAVYAARNPNCQLLLPGSLDRRLEGYRAELEQLSQTLGVSDKVRFLGRVKLSELRALYQVADVFVCASEHEGFCVPVIEAMAFRVPVVACRQTAVRETVEGAGIWWPEPDPMTLAESMDLCMTNPSAAETIKHAQIQHYKGHYSLPMLREKFLNYVQGALNG